MKWLYKPTVIICMTIMLLALTACGSKSDSGNNNSGKKSQPTAWEQIKNEGTLVVGTAGTLYASSYHKKGSDKLTGYDVEIVREIAQRLNLNIKFEEMGFDQMLSSLNSGKIDIAANDIGVTDKRKQKIQFSMPYKYSYCTAIVRAEDHSGIESLEDLKGKKAAGASSSIYSQIARQFGAKIRTYGNATNDVYLRDVDLGRTDVILNDYYLQLQALKAFPKYDLVMHPDIKFNQSSSAIAMKKDADELQKKINETLKAMKQDGTLTKLSKQFYLDHDVSKKPDVDVREVELEQ